MIKKSMSLKELRKLLTRVSRNCQVSLYLPFTDVRNPTWEEVRQHAAEAYGAAVTDVLDAMAGDPSGLQAALTERGRTLVSPEHVEYLREALEQAYTERLANLEPPEDLDEWEDEEEQDDEGETPKSDQP